MNNRTRAYTYDDIGRLRGETISGDIDLNMTYAYDMRGNRTGKTVTGDENYTISSTYDNNNRLTKQTKSADGIQTNATQYYYDNNGNQTFKQHFTYSAGELMSMSVGTESDDRTVLYHCIDFKTSYIVFNSNSYLFLVSAGTAFCCAGADNHKSNKYIHILRRRSGHCDGV